jgi:hypothetical protein
LCDPISALALAGSALAAGVSYQGQQATQQAQQQANDDWVAYQRKAAADAAAKDDANRQKAQAALSGAEGALTPASQQANQQRAQADLTNQMLAGSPASSDVNTTALGLDKSADASITQDIGQRVTNAARDAQSRIAALAGLTSYGGGYNDMGSLASQALQNSQEGINLASDFRKGDTATLGIAQNVQPIHYQAGSDIAGTLASQLAGIAGSAYGTKMRTA